MILGRCIHSPHSIQVLSKRCNEKTKRIPVTSAPIVDSCITHSRDSYSPSIHPPLLGTFCPLCLYSSVEFLHP